MHRCRCLPRVLRPRRPTAAVQPVPEALPCEHCDSCGDDCSGSAQARPEHRHVPVGLVHPHRVTSVVFLALFRGSDQESCHSRTQHASMHGARSRDSCCYAGATESARRALTQRRGDSWRSGGLSPPCLNLDMRSWCAAPASRQARCGGAQARRPTHGQTVRQYFTAAVLFVMALVHRDVFDAKDAGRRCDARGSGGLTCCSGRRKNDGSGSQATCDGAEDGGG